jgi:hypothetical protein
MERILRHFALTAVLATAPAADPGTADALVLVIPGFAEQMRLGEAGWSLGGAAWAAAGNPSTLAGGFSASGGGWSFETSTAAVAAAFQPMPGVFAGGFFRYAGRGGLTGRDGAGVETGEYSWSSGSAGAAGAFPLPFGIRGGLSAGTVWEDVDDQGASGITCSAGLSLSPSDGIEAGLALLNIGSAPSWDGIAKNMPAEVSAGARWRSLPFISIVAGASAGFWTSSRFSAAAEFSAGGLTASAGLTEVPDQDQAGGLFGGLCWRFGYESEYSAEIATRQVGDLAWPVSAGISIAF